MDPAPQPEKRYFERRLRVSIEKVEAALASAYQIRRLTEDELTNLPRVTFYEAAWEVVHAQTEQAPSLIVAVDFGFPARSPFIIVPDSERWFLKVPHVDKRGTFCVLPWHAVIDQFNCGTAVLEVVESAIALMLEGLNGANQDEFVRETEGYWTQIKEPPELVAVCELSGVSRWLTAAWIKPETRLAVGDTSDEVGPWMSLFPHGDYYGFEVAFVWRDTPLRPAGYPATNADIFRMVSEAGLGDPAHLAYRAWKQPFYAIIAFQTAEGIAAIATSAKGFQQPLLGFSNPHSITGEMLLKRWGDLTCRKHIVERADPDWLHWRGGADEDRSAISAASVTVVGCGAVGADVAMLLAKAGVRRFVLADHDNLALDNIGRHLLGAPAVGEAKAKALAVALMRHFPHIQSRSSVHNIELICRREGKMLREQDLIICITADWMGESVLNTWGRKFATKPIIFAWLEPHGLAGHALLVTPNGNGGCLACGRNEGGEVRDPVIDWADKPQYQKIPACGGWFTPYGAIDSGPTKEMIAQLALDALTGAVTESTLRTFIGDRRRIESHGGKIREPWQRFASDDSILNRTTSQPWPANPDCPWCKPQKKS